MCPTGAHSIETDSSFQGFFTVDEGEYSIGLGEQAFKEAAAAAVRAGLKEEFIRNSSPAHRVRLNRISISMKLVTFEEFLEFTGDTGYTTEAEEDGWAWTWEGRWSKRNGLSWRSPFGDEADAIYCRNGDILPALQLSWNDAAAYCLWLGEKNGMPVSLPSEAQWEVFAGATSEWCSRGVRTDVTGEAAPGSGAYISAIVEETKRCGGLHGTGLVWEWCDDWFDAYPGGVRHREFGKIYRVLRGGSLASSPVQKMPFYRFRRCPTARSPFYGFRIARP